MHAGAPRQRAALPPPVRPRVQLLPGSDVPPGQDSAVSALAASDPTADELRRQQVLNWNEAVHVQWSDA